MLQPPWLILKKRVQRNLKPHTQQILDCCVSLNVYLSVEVAVRFTVRLTGRPEELSFKGNDMFLCAAITRCDRLNVQEWTFSCWAQNKKLLVGHTFHPIFNNVFMYQQYQLCL